MRKSYDEMCPELDDFQPTRVSAFSIFRKPRHDTAYSPVELATLIGFAKDDQLGIVLSCPDSDEPTEWHGPGIDDLR